MEEFVEGKRVIVGALTVTECRECPHLSRGFLSEPDECGFFKEVYTWFVPRTGIPKWCPMPEAESVGEE